MTDTATLDELVDTLERTAGRLRSGDLSPDAAATLVEDCARTAGEAVGELDRLHRLAGQDPLPGPAQDSLL